jgi:NDP-sugar pyrophosphorylase family protein
MSESLLPVAILAGGLATRLRPLTETVPKALLDINGEPFIVHQLRLLRANGVERVVICAGYLGELIEAAVGDGSPYGLRVAYSFDGWVLLGTAGPIKTALPLLGPAFFVLYGDSYLPCDYRAVQAAFERSGRPALMVVFANDGRWDASNVEFGDGRLLAYNKRAPTPAMRHIDYGLGVFRATAFDAVPSGQPADLADLYQNLARRGELAGYEVAQRFYEIGSPAGLEETRRYLPRRAGPAP